MNRETIIEYLSENKQIFKKEFGITKIGLFGSYARGHHNKDNDIDIVVELEKPDLLSMVGIKQKIEENLGIKWI